MTYSHFPKSEKAEKHVVELQMELVSRLHRD